MWKHTSLSLLFACFGCGAEETAPLFYEDAPRSERQLAILALVNDPYVGVEELDHGVELDARAARNIVARRPFATLEELDAIPYVGPVALAKLYNYAFANGYLSSYQPTPIDELPVRQDVQYDAAILASVLAEARITDADAVLTRAKLETDDGDRILSYEELALAAVSCREDLWTIDGYRFSESIVLRIMEAFELEDRLALLRTGVAHDADANRYLSQAELERARVEITYSRE